MVNWYNNMGIIVKSGNREGKREKCMGERGREARARQRESEKATRETRKGEYNNEANIRERVEKRCAHKVSRERKKVVEVERGTGGSCESDSGEKEKKTENERE